MATTATAERIKGGLKVSANGTYVFIAYADEAPISWDAISELLDGRAHDLIKRHEEKKARDGVGDVDCINAANRFVTVNRAIEVSL